MSDGQDQDKVGQDSIGNPETSLTIGDKSYSKQDVENLLSQHSDVTQKSQQLSGILQRCDALGISPTDYAHQAESAFGALNNLMEAGLIDNQGNIVQKKDFGPGQNQVPQQSGYQPQDQNFQVYQPQGQPQSQGESPEEIAARALNPLQTEIQMLKQDVDSLIRLNLQQNLKSQYPELDDSDISMVLVNSQKDRSKTMADHARAIMDQKKGYKERMEQEFAKKYNINIEEFNANKLKEQEAQGGAGAIFKNKKFTFNKKFGEEGKVTPREAMEEYFKRINMER